MRSLKPKSIKSVNKKDNNPFEELIEQSFERFNNIREGVMKVFQEHDMPPILMYRIALELDFLATFEYQQYLINHTERLIQEEDEEISQVINWDHWEKLLDNDNVEEKLQKSWKKVIDILRQEKVKVLEIARIAPEIRTSAMETLIHAVGGYVDEKNRQADNEE